jgi:plastocyanin
MKRSVWSVVAVVLVLGAAACGGDDDDDGDGDDTPAADAAPGTPDAAPTGCTLAYVSGCTTPTDLTGMTKVTVMISGLTYGANNCIKVKAGTEVTIQASDSHPLASESCSPAGIPASSAKATADLKFTAAEGLYNYFCTAHKGAGMKGVIEVVP